MSFEYCTTEAVVSIGCPNSRIPQPIYPFTEQGRRVPSDTTWALTSTIIATIGERDCRIVWTWMRATEGSRQIELAKAVQRLNQLIWFCADCLAVKPILQTGGPTPSTVIAGDASPCDCGNKYRACFLSRALDLWDKQREEGKGRP